MKKQFLESGEKVITVDEKEQQQQETPHQPTQALSAYQLFMKDKKQEGKFSLQIFSEMWKELPLDYKQQYQEKARLLKEQVQQNKVAAPETYFPLSRLKTILKEDEERPQFKAEGYIYLLKAIEGFGEILLNKVKDQVRQDQRKIVKEDDLITTIKENQELRFLDCLASHHQKKKVSQENAKGNNLVKTVGALDQFLEKNNG